jgi:hypothetical protein
MTTVAGLLGGRDQSYLFQGILTFGQEVAMPLKEGFKKMNLNVEVSFTTTLRRSRPPKASP